jgi:hypothetical protein
VPVSVTSAVAKVKNLLVGLAPTDAEVQAVTANPAALDRLVGQWMTLPQYNEKMLRFFVSAFQQDQFTSAQLVFQLGFYPAFNNPPQIIQEIQESFARTAMELVAEGRPFTETMTTTRFMMTPALAAAYALFDIIHVGDNYLRSDLFQQTHPTRVTLESSRRIPIESAINPSSPDFMTFYDPTIATAYGPGCPTGTIVYPSPAGYRVLADFLYGQQPAPFGSPLCQPPMIPPADRYITDSDVTTWRMVTIRTPHAGEATTPFYDLPALRSSPELVLNVPRVSFFTTPAFFTRWTTNDSNQARVLINQTMLVALGKPFEANNPAEPIETTTIDRQHSAPDSPCYGCHLALDPMRQIFRHTYTLYSSAQDNFLQLSMVGQFAFYETGPLGASINDLGAQLATHPLFAPAWVQRLCTYATSAPCDETDPEFQRLVEVFRSSHYAWPALVRALFASPLVTYLRPTQTATTAGQPFPIARQEHLCAMLSTRLGIPDVCGLDVTTPDPSPVLHALASSWPSGQYSRGNPNPALAVAPSLLLRGGMESLCTDLARRLVDDSPASVFPTGDPATAIEHLATRLMGLTHDRTAGPKALLQSHFNDARQMGASPQEAMQSTFTLACLSPYVAGVGQ